MVREPGIIVCLEGVLEGWARYCAEKEGLLVFLLGIKAVLIEIMTGIVQSKVHRERSGIRPLEDDGLEACQCRH